MLQECEVEWNVGWVGRVMWKAANVNQTGEGGDVKPSCVDWSCMAVLGFTVDTGLTVLLKGRLVLQHPHRVPAGEGREGLCRELG